MQRVFAAVFAEFLQFQPVLDDLFILARIIIRLLAHRALHLDEIILGHNE